MNNPRESDNAAVNEALRVRMPATISVRDVFFIISVVVSGIVAFGSLSSRTSVIEAQMTEMKSNQIESIKNNLIHKQEIMKKFSESEQSFDSRIKHLELDVERLKLRLEYISKPKKSGE